MTNDTRNDTPIDPALSDHLKSIGGETTPADLDAAILREAKRAMRADTRRGAVAAWFRPLAFVATVGLSLAIILEFSDLGVLTPAPDADRAPLPAGIALPTEMPDARSGNRGQATLNELKRQEKTPAGGSQTEDTDDTGRPPQSGLTKLQPQSPPAERTRDGEAFSVESDNALQRLEATRETAVPSRAAGVSEEVSPGPAGAVMSSTGACSDAQRATPDAWWQCVEALRRAGQEEAAEREIEALRKAFPDFEPPR